ncbi:MAG: hypothetical protein C0397_12315 [Odoribacter sp.]|nr:hypothetical protein [Odoribacter sp.]
MQEHRPERSLIFNDEVTIITHDKEESQIHLVISEFEKFSNYKLYIGILAPENKVNAEIDGHQFADEIYSLLKHENIKISDALGEKITEIFKQKSLNHKNQRNNFYTKRENQVLCLSMEGLPIKIIADRLSISDRTVLKNTEQS